MKVLVLEAAADSVAAVGTTKSQPAAVAVDAPVLMKRRREMWMVAAVVVAEQSYRRGR